MVNPKTGERELAYIVTIDDINPIPGYDRVEHATVLGWRVIVQKDQFKVGDLAIYIEIDSKCPATEQFAFLEKRHYAVKTIKMCKVLSQGLLMSLSDFGWTPEDHPLGTCVSKELGITYNDPEDNRRKAPSPDKYKVMADQHKKLFKNPFFKWLLAKPWGRKLLFAFFGKKAKKKTWPSWVVKTDEIRVQNMPWIVDNKDRWIATEKIDGTSTTFTLHKGKFGKRDFYVCSRNVVFDKPNKECYYDTNVYLEMADKYNVKKVLNTLMDHADKFATDSLGKIVFITLQGETYGDGIQKRDYGTKEHKFAAFNLIYGFEKETIRFDSIRMTNTLKPYNIPSVPIVNKAYSMPGTVDEILAYADGVSEIDGGMREGLVFRTLDGKNSFKAVSNEYLLKYHG